MNKLPEHLVFDVNELSDFGNELFEEGDMDRAYKAWTEALKLIPEPKNTYSEAVWIEAALGDVHFLKKEYMPAKAHFLNARGNVSGEGVNNPFVLMRLGQCHYEMRDSNNALEFMLRAYMMAGEDVFSADDPKYLEFVKTKLNIK